MRKEIKDLVAKWKKEKKRLIKETYKAKTSIETSTYWAVSLKIKEFIDDLEKLLPEKI